VRLCDQFGRPIEALPPGGEPDRRHVRERSGARTFNAYPIRCFEPGTRRVARPNAGPEVDPPRLLTPPPR
jgi:hypothetical protein